MDQNSFKKKYLENYHDLFYVFWPEEGFIVWRIGTGDNAELLHIRTFKKRQGIGKRLFLEMLKGLQDHPPYYSVFGFTRVDNIEAENFYKKLGFNIEYINGLYKDGNCKLFWASYEELYEKHIGDLNGPHNK